MAIGRGDGDVSSVDVEGICEGDEGGLFGETDSSSVDLGDGSVGLCEGHEGGY